MYEYIHIRIRPTHRVMVRHCRFLFLGYVVSLSHPQGSFATRFPPVHLRRLAKETVVCFCKMGLGVRVRSLNKHNNGRTVGSGSSA